MANILVTGATGTIGSNLIQALHHEKLEFRVGARRPEAVKEKLPAGVEAVAFDFEQPSTFEAALQGIEQVFLLIPFVEHFDRLVEPFLKAAKKAGVSFILHISAAGADPQSPLRLAQQHGAVDQAIAESGIAWSIVKPNFFQDNILNFHAQTIVSQGAFYGSSAEGKAAFVSSKDIGDVSAAILKNPSAHHGKSYTLSGPENLSSQDVAQLLSKLLGKTVSYVNIEPAAQRQAMEAQHLPGWMIDGLVGLENVKAQGWAVGQPTDIEQVLGRKAETYEVFLKRNLQRLQ